MCICSPIAPPSLSTAPIDLLSQIGVHDGTRWTTTNVQVPVEMQCVVFTPSKPMSTQEARSMLPDKVCWRVNRKRGSVEAINGGESAFLLSGEIRRCREKMPFLTSAAPRSSVLLLPATVSSCSSSVRYRPGSGALLSISFPNKGCLFSQQSLPAKKQQLISFFLATQDAMHQPIRGRPEIMPALFPVIEAALSAGALGELAAIRSRQPHCPASLPTSRHQLFSQSLVKGAFLSGAGSSIMALSSGMRGDVYTQHHSERNDRDVGC